MKILFAGTPDFAVPSLEITRERHPVVGVLTQADAPQGRGKLLKASPVKEKALALSIPVFEPLHLDEELRELVKNLSPDILVCVAYGKIFKKKFLDLFKLGGINVHPSLLPKYRGPSPIPAAILAGDSSTGVTIQRLALKMDSGNILAQTAYPLTGNETTASLTAALATLGAGLLSEVLDRIVAQTAEERQQDEDAATYSSLVKKEDGRLSWEESALGISRMIRAYTPWPLVYTGWKDKRLFFLSGGVYPHQSQPSEAAPGTVLGMDKDYGILIHTCNGILFVAELQLEYKKALSWRDFLNGNRDLIGSVCGGTA